MGNKSEHPFELRITAVALANAFTSKSEAGINVGKLHIAPATGLRQVGREFKNIQTRLAEITQKSPVFPNDIESRINPDTGLSNLYWAGDEKDMPIARHYELAVDEAKKAKKPIEVVRLREAELRLWQITEQEINGLKDGEALNYFAPLSDKPADGVSFGQIKRINGQLKQQFNILPFKDAVEVKKFIDQIKQKQNMLVSGDTEGVMSPLLFWVAKGTPIDFKNDLPLLILQSQETQNIELRQRPNIIVDVNRADYSNAHFGFWQVDVSRIGQNSRVQTKEKKVVAESEKFDSVVNTAAVVATVSIGEKLAESAAVNIVNRVTSVITADIATESDLNTNIAVRTEAADDIWVEKTNIPEATITKGDAVALKAGVNSAVTVAAPEQPVMLFEERKGKIKKTEKTVDKKTIKPEPVKVEVPVMTMVNSCGIEAKPDSANEAVTKPIETVVFEYAFASEDPIEATGSEEKASHSETVNIPHIKAEESNVKEEIVIRGDVVDKAKKYTTEIKPVKENMPIFRQQLIDVILMTMLKKYQLEKIRKPEPEAANQLNPDTEPATAIKTDGKTAIPQTDMERLEVDIKQDTDVAVKPKTKTKTKINLSFLALLFLVKIRLQSLLAVTPGFISTYIYADKLLEFAAHPELFLLNSKQPQLARSM